MNLKTTNQPYFKSLLSSVMIVVMALVALCNAANASADSPPVVTLTASYHGTWSVYYPRADLDYSLCAAITEEQPLENCLSTTANTDNNTIVDPWTQTSIINDDEDWAKPATPDPYCISLINCPSGPFSVGLAMSCPNGGAPNPTIYGDEGAVVRGWCLVLGEAPPPATAPTCANNEPPSTGQPTCVSPGELNTGDPDDCQCGGDPINIGSGNMYFQTTDYKTRGPFPLEFTRSYNSAIANQGVSPDGADQALGAGWTSNVTGPHLYINTIQQYITCSYQDGNGNPVNYICPTATSPSLVTVWDPDGRQSVLILSKSIRGSDQAGLITSRIQLRELQRVLLSGNSLSMYWA